MSTIVNIDEALLQGLYGSLSDEVNGFNARLRDLSAAQGSIRGFTPFTIDFSDTSRNFVFGRVPADLMESNGLILYPVLTIDTAGWESTSFIVGATFSGTMLGVVEIHLSWPQSYALPDFARATNVVASAVQNTLNDVEHLNYPGGLIWNGHILCVRSPVIAAGSNFRRTLTFTAKIKGVFAAV